MLLCALLHDDMLGPSHLACRQLLLLAEEHGPQRPLQAGRGGV